MKPNSEIRARVYQLPAEKGGRRTPVSLGYRAPLWFGRVAPDRRKAYNDGVITLEGQLTALPGEWCTVRVRLLCPELVPEPAPGSTFELAEPPRAIGKATVIEVVPAQVAPV